MQSAEDRQEVVPGRRRETVQRQNQNPLRHSTLTRKAEQFGDPGKPVCLMLLESQIKEDGEAEREVKPRSHRALLQRHVDLT